LLKTQQDGLDPSIDCECSAALCLSRHLKHTKNLHGVALGCLFLACVSRGIASQSFVWIAFVTVALAVGLSRQIWFQNLIGALKSRLAWRKRTLIRPLIK